MIGRSGKSYLKGNTDPRSLFLIHTAALARWKSVPLVYEPFQRFRPVNTKRLKPLKRLIVSNQAWGHRAKAAV
jgi:hypothetical protein